MVRTGKDKLYHIIACALLSCGTFVVLFIAHDDRCSCNTICLNPRGSNNDDDNGVGGNENVNVSGYNNAEGDSDADAEMAVTYTTPSDSAGEPNNTDNDNDTRHNNNPKKCPLCIRILSIFGCHQIPKKYYIMAAKSGFVAMTIGALKEIGDAYNFWPILCQTGCTASWADILADLIGVAFGEIMIVLALCFRYATITQQIT